jgi:hypothetical protein
VSDFWYQGFDVVGELSQISRRADSPGNGWMHHATPLALNDYFFSGQSDYQGSRCRLPDHDFGVPASKNLVDLKSHVAEPTARIADHLDVLGLTQISREGVSIQSSAPDVVAYADVRDS